MYAEPVQELETFQEVTQAKQLVVKKLWKRVHRFRLREVCGMLFAYMCM
jgi:hypothetical protein